jgi:hypothetical protein
MFKKKVQKICPEDSPPYVLLCEQKTQPRIQILRLMFVLASANSANNCEQPTAYNITEPVDQIQNFCYRTSTDYSICVLDTSYVKGLLTKSYQIPQSYNRIPLRFEVT